MKLPSIIGHCAEMIRIIWKSPQPADVVASSYLRSKKYIGSKERKAISEIVFGILRIRRTIDHTHFILNNASKAAIPIDDTINVMTGILLLNASKTIKVYDSLKSATGDDTNDEVVINQLVKHIESLMIEPVFTNWIHVLLGECEKFNIWCTGNATDAGLLHDDDNYSNVADWIAQNWSTYKFTTISPPDFYRQLIRSAPFTIRVNTLLSSREVVLGKLLSEGYKVEPTMYSPHGIIFQDRVQIMQHPLMQSGVIEVQDEGSQLTGFALSPEKHWQVLDACSGAGGKSLHCAVMQNDEGKIISSDIEPKRLKELYHRAKRANINSIHIQPLVTLQTDERRRLEDTMDAVFIDAPCSGMGTIRRMPMTKWRLTPDQLYRITATQRSIIQEYSVYVKQGGVLLYVTCSLMREENEQIVEWFLNENPNFVGEPLAPVFAKHGVKIPGLGDEDWFTTLSPFPHNTDGFFVARMRRND